MTTTAVQYGIGPIGRRIVQVAAARGIDFVGAIDIDPEKVGQDLAAVANLDTETGVTVTDDPDTALAEEPDVVFHSTLSDVTAITPQIEAAVAAGADVISTTEELSYPWYHQPDAAAELDEIARENGQTVLGTGINPGFAMDTLPAVLTTPCQDLDRVQITRVQNASQRRKPLQEKVGAGLAEEVWEEEIAPEAGHVGLPESIAMLAAALDWDLESIEETIDPVVAETRTESEYFTAEPGEVAGIHQIGTGYVDGEPAIELDLSMFLGAENPRDEIEISGTPDLHVTVDGGFHGDVTTPAVVVNAAPRVKGGRPGLATMIDLATPRFAERP
ncbi:hypothetical protein RH831_07230 [Halodesulfurarchaeum sp. HSR-GB]|uniref:NAD(P)H-dependent amine dehydrogenase family protein n=1 Tax=Halodesulfurarchaeum sp. HSR-GB TaxID=3074077 RepID=UPI00285E565B|nr:hypothetical protein [Halodesulfurarchaeum sp. HSR-GB]MDR5656973.1 hypothetical protein [Halodesulfurarchaeum sp. HSR-GB]